MIKQYHYFNYIYNLTIKSIILSTKLAGYVQEVLVNEAQKVKKGDTLVRIDNIELLSNLEVLKVTLMM